MKLTCNGACLSNASRLGEDLSGFQESCIPEDSNVTVHKCPKRGASPGREQVPDSLLNSLADLETQLQEANRAKVHLGLNSLYPVLTTLNTLHAILLHNLSFTAADGT